jgi:NADPH:quinone reductase
MRAIVYDEAGSADVLRLIDRTPDEPGTAEVRVRIAASGINPADWKGRSGYMGPVTAESVPHVDGSGVIDAVGPGVDRFAIGDRVWITNPGKSPYSGTAQELVVLPAAHVFPLPDDASFELGAAIGVPAVTAYRALTTIEGFPTRLSPGALAGATILVAGGAGAVGHAAIQLARWAGATVIATVSGPQKMRLALAAGAHEAVNYRDPDAAQLIRGTAVDGVDAIVEVAAGANAALDAAVLRPLGSIAIYDDAGDGESRFDPFALWFHNARIQLVALPALPPHVLSDAGSVVAEAMSAFSVGEEAGLAVVQYPLERAADAHRELERGVVGKVLLSL